MQEQTVADALRGLIKLLDDHDLVRNIDSDNDVMAFTRQGVRITKALKAAQKALEIGNSSNAPDQWENTMIEPLTPESHQRTPQDVLKYWRDKLHEHRYSEKSCLLHEMPDQSKWHEGQADAIDHFLLDLEYCILKENEKSAKLRVERDMSFVERDAAEWLAVALKNTIEALPQCRQRDDATLTLMKYRETYPVK